MNTQHPKKVILLSPAGGKSIAKKLFNDLKGKHTFEFQFCEKVDEALAAIVSCPYGLFIFEITDKVSLGTTLNVLKKTRKITKESHIKVGGFNTLKSKNVDKALKKLGCDDYFEPTITPKSFSFKLDFWFKTLKPKVEAQAADTVEEQKSENNKSNENLKLKRGNQVIPKDPIDCENDYWLLVHPNDCKNILRRWLIKLVGPSPFAGKWHQQPSIKNRRKQVWQYVLSDTNKDKFQESDGFWSYDGPKPEFDWKENKWIFSGPNPSLFFESEDEEEVYYRFKFEEGNLEIAKNSMFAEMKKTFIEETFEKDFEHKNKLEEDKSKETYEGEQSEENPESHRGEGSQADQYSGVYEGESQGDSAQESESKRSQGEKEDLGSGNYASDSSFQEEREENQSGRSNFKEEALSDMDGKSSTDDLGPTHYSNQSEYKEAEEAQAKRSNFQEKAQSDMSGSGKTDDLGSNHYNNQSTYKEDESSEAKKSQYKEDQKSDMGGSSSTDDLGPSHYSNQSEYQENKDKEAGRSQFKDAQSSDMSGTNSTDDLGPSHYSNQSSQGGEKTNSDMSGQSQFKENNKGDMGGKNSTDDLGPSHYSNDSEYKEQERKGNNQSSFKEKNASDMGGKSSTDDMGSSHYSNQTSDPSSRDKKDREKSASQYEHNKNKDSDESSTESKRPRLIGKKVERENPSGPTEFGSANQTQKQAPQYSEDSYEKSEKSSPQYESDNSKNFDEPIQENSEDYYDDILSDRSYASSETQYSEEEGYSFEVGKGAKREESAENELGINFEEMTSSGEVKVIIEKEQDGDIVKYIASFEDIFVPEIVLGVKNTNLQVDEVVNIYMLIKYLDSKVSLTVKSTVTEVDVLEGDESIITLELQEYNKERIEKFMSLFVKRQEYISQFMGLAKGY